MLNAKVTTDIQMFYDKVTFRDNYYFKDTGSDEQLIQIVDNNLGWQLEKKNLEWVLRSENYVKNKFLYRGIKMSHKKDEEGNDVRVIDFVEQEEKKPAELVL